MASTGGLVAVDLASFQVSRDRGFLPSPDPLDRLPAPFVAWEELGAAMPKLLAAGRFRRAAEALPTLDVAPLRGERELRRAMVLLSYFGHGFVWGEHPPAARIPAPVAVPWCQVARRLGRPPVLSYASYVTDNWRRLDPGGPIRLGNIALLQNFLGGMDEEWFILVHAEIEAKAGPPLAAIPRAQAAAARDDAGAAEQALSVIAGALDGMYSTLLRMPERCDPYIYYHRVRPYIFGWKDNPALPDGVVYEGVAEYGALPQRSRGETGAQSAIIPSLDAALGITHHEDPLRPYLLEMRDYMPPPHRAFVQAVERGPSVRAFVQHRRHSHPSLRDAYNACIEELARFRTRHLEYAARYIQRQVPPSPENPTAVGTGGTPFMPYLKKHRDETEAHRIGSPG